MPTILLDLEGLAAFLKVSPRMAQDLAKNYPCFHLSDKTKRYDQEEVAEYLREQRAHAEQHAQNSAGLHPRKLKAIS